MSRKRRVTIEQQTTTTTTVTAEETTTGPLPWAPGWDGESPGHAVREQRARQVARCLRFLAVRSFGSDQEDTLRCATVILRAGPGASPLELEHGRSL